MPLTISNTTGDGIVTDYLDCDIELADSGMQVLIAGSIQAAGGAKLAISGSPLTAPSAPGSGFIYWIIQVNTTTGVATIKQSTSSMPSADAGNDIVFQQTLGVGNTDSALVATDTTPDNF